MPEYTQHELTQLHARARQQIRFLALAHSPEAASNRRFLAAGYLLALTEAKALTLEQAEELRVELSAVTEARIDALIKETLRDTLAPEPGGVHCTGHVDYAPKDDQPDLFDQLEDKA
jgi:hypothetical protein